MVSSLFDSNSNCEGFSIELDINCLINIALRPPKSSGISIASISEDISTVSIYLIEMDWDWQKNTDTANTRVGNFFIDFKVMQ